MWAKKAIETLTDAFPGRDYSDGNFRFYQQEFEKLADDYGVERAEKALRATLRDPEASYFTIAQLRGHIPPANVPKTLLSFAEPNCDRCLGSGWEMISVSGETAARARRCFCWERNRRSGIQHAPVSLNEEQVAEERKTREALAFKAKLRELARAKDMDPPDRPHGRLVKRNFSHQAKNAVKVSGASSADTTLALEK